jgi:hypothetical protein
MSCATDADALSGTEIHPLLKRDEYVRYRTDGGKPHS